jgi:metal-responsive CopG/Arc/MetJ family transcriptional regulator
MYISIYNDNQRGDDMKFIPKNGEKEVISFRLPKELLSTIDKIAIDHSLSRNEFMIQCLEFALDNLDENDR